MILGGLIYWCDHLLDDDEALRRHLNLAETDLLAYSARVATGVLCATRSPERIDPAMRAG